MERRCTIYSCRPNCDAALCPRLEELLGLHERRVAVQLRSIDAPPDAPPLAEYIGWLGEEEDDGSIKGTCVITQAGHGSFALRREAPSAQTRPGGGLSNLGSGDHVTGIGGRPAPLFVEPFEI